MPKDKKSAKNTKAAKADKKGSAETEIKPEKTATAKHPNSW